MIKLFGGVAIPCARCPECEETSFVLEGVSGCCRAIITRVGKRVLRESSGSYRRKTPSAKAKTKILEEQENKCLYCNQTFGDYYLKKTRLLLLKPVWDHSLPWSYDNNNADVNFVAACSVCNNWKSNKIFKDLEEARNYLLRKWRSKRTAPTMLEEEHDGEL